MVVLCLTVWNLLSHVDQSRSSVSSVLLVLGACGGSSALPAVGRGPWRERWARPCCRRFLWLLSVSGGRACSPSRRTVVSAVLGVLPVVRCFLYRRHA